MLQLRASTFAGDAPAAAEVKDRLEALAAMGTVRVAGGFGLRLAHDLARTGATDDAQVLHRWGLEHLPVPSRWTSWERLWARTPADGAGPSDERGREGPPWPRPPSGGVAPGLRSTEGHRGHSAGSPSATGAPRCG